MPVPPGTYGGGLYGGGVYGGGLPRMPTMHYRIALDRDGYDLGGICTGVNSTCEALGDWQGINATLTLNNAVSRCYTGEHSIRVTATADGQASAIIYGLGGVGAIQPGRTYLLWVHVRPETMVRDVRAVLLWKSATDVYLTAAAAVPRPGVATGWTRVGVLATAPPAAERLDIAVDWIGCAAGEVHYLDTVTVEDVGTNITPWVLSAQCTLSGRNQALSRTEAGTAKLQLDNGDGRFTPGRSATTLAPYAGNIVPRRRIWIIAEHMGVLYPVWSGYTQRWTQSIPASIATASEVTLDCTDGFRWLTAATIAPPYRAQILADRPLSYYPLDESSEATSAGDLVAGAPAALRIAASGDGKSAFGAASVLPKLESGQTTDAGSSSLAFNQADDLGTSGAVLDLRYAGGVPPVASIGWTFEVWIGAPESAPAVAQIVFRHVIPIAGIDYLSGFQLVILDTGQLRLVTGGSETVATSAPSICNGGSYHVAITLESGGPFGTARLWLNGGQVGSLELTANPMPVGTPTVAQLGGAMADITSEPSFLFTGRAGHVAFWYRRLSDLELYLHALGGSDGYRLETEADRLRAILQYVGWPVEDTRLDAGLTQLLPRAWSETNPLALAQDTTETAGSAVVMDALGRLRYPHRHRWVNWVPVQADFRQSFNSEVEADIQPWLDDDGIANVVKVSRVGGANIAVRDEASIARYGPIEGDALPLGAASDDESLIHARWKLRRTAEPRTRIDTATVRPDNAGSMIWPILLPLEFGHRIAIGDTPTTAPDPEIDALVGQIAHQIGNEEWVTTLRLEAAVIDTVWVLDDPLLGVLDTPPAVLGY